MEPDAHLEISVDRDAATPLYDQVAREIERAIADGRLAKGAFLGNEVLLADRWGLSRITVQRAVQQLVGVGLLVRRRGIGTQVVSDRIARPARLASLFDDLTEAKRHPTTTVLAHERVVADDPIARCLGLSIGSEVVYIERCRYADGRRLAVIRNWIVADVARGLTTNALASSGLYQLLREQGVWPHSSRKSISAAVASPVDAALLGIAVGAPILVSEATMQDRSGRTVEYAEHVHSGREYRMDLLIVEN